MGKMKKNKAEFRYYELPQDAPLLARMGEKWKIVYGSSEDDKHFHNLLEIGYCHYGDGKLILGEEERAFTGGMVSVIPPNYLHHTLSSNNEIAYWEYLFVDVEKFLIEYYKEDIERIKSLTKRIYQEARFINENDNKQLVYLIRAILEEFRGEKKLYMESVRGLLLSALMEILRMSGQAEEKHWSAGGGSARISPALFYISDYYREKIKIEQLAEVCHMSETHFRRVFVKCMNMTPVEYVNLVRIRMACEMLKKSEDSMEEIAEKAGFDTLSTFNRNFRKLIGDSPYQWKLHAQNYEQKLLNYKISAYKGW